MEYENKENFKSLETNNSNKKNEFQANDKNKDLYINKKHDNSNHKLIEDNYYHKYIIFLLFILYLLSYFISTNYKEFYLTTAYFLSLISNLTKILFLYKNKNPFQFTVKLIVFALIIYYLIKEPNPFFNLFFIWLPFDNYFKGLFMFEVFLYFINREIRNFENNINSKITDKINDPNEKHESNPLPLFYSTRSNSFNKLKILKIFYFLILLKLSLFIFDEHFSYLLINKQQLTNQKYFISANLYNNEDIIQDWTGEMLKLIDFLGPSNCIVSILENGDSTDKTAIYLNDFQTALNEKKVKNRIITTKIIDKGSYERIVFLTLLRNRVLEFIHYIEELDFNYTKILFFNDIIFSFKDIIKLINTNDQNYDVACGLDFYESFYDTWVSFGIDGVYLRYYYPYFTNKAAQDRVVNGDNVRVFSCWNGVVSMKAAPFANGSLSFRYPVKIRQSECILLLTDLWELNHSKVILNPNLKFAYTYYFYYMNKFVYPWTKNWITYFYYYFIYFLEKSDSNFCDLSSSNVELPEMFLYQINTYLKR